ncbi:MAG TPA: ribonuclease H-like domain-containing protein [Vicinamibacterales bacterium]|nr:ribonuclease H-like domain-containing protein [Vicinamibacterales bacterium]
MSSLTDRLRGIIAAVPANEGAPSRLRQGSGEAGRSEAEAAGPPDSSFRDDAAEVLGGSWHHAGGRQLLVIDRTYRPGHRHGHLTLVDHVLGDECEWRHVLLGPLSPSNDDSNRSRTLFIDLETSGLAGGAGTSAFLVGCAWFDGCVLRVRQLFMASPTAERVLLDALVELASSARLLVSYNGKSFDLPLIETRFLFNRMEPPFAGVPHLDMLHAARRLWRPIDAADGDTSAEGAEAGAPRRSAEGAEPGPPRRSAEGAEAGCSLGVLERSICGHDREGDVAGFEIPARYFHYVRTGDARPLAAVVEHNRLDLLSLAFLTARAARLVHEGPVAVRTAREAVGLGRLYERAGIVAKARACFARACGLDGSSALPGDKSTLADALRAYAQVCRRERSHADAATAWRRLIALGECPPHVYREAIEALAIHHEHRLREPRVARDFALSSLPLQGTAARQLAIRHRLARLDRKVERDAQNAWLF